MSDSTPKQDLELSEEPGSTETETPTGDEPAGPATPSTPRSGLPSLTREILNGNLDQPVELTEFMFKLGLHYNLPGRDATAPATPFLKKRSTRIWIVGLAAVITVLGGVVPVLAKSDPVSTLPPEVRGEWHTSSPRYTGRKLILSEDRVRIDFGDHAAAVEFPISEVHRRDTPEGVQYQVLYRQDRGLTQFVFTFAESTWPASIQLPNPAGVDWVRARDVEAVREQARRASQLRSRGQPRVP